MHRKKLSVIGIGRLGLCFALSLERSGKYHVVGRDIDPEYVSKVYDRSFTSVEPNVTKYLKEATNFTPTTDLKTAVEHGDIIFITLRTESEGDGKYDCSQINFLVKELIELGKSKETKHLVLCSNVNPGYSDFLYERLKKYNYTVSFNPEWVAQGSILQNQKFPDTVVIGEQDVETGDLIEEVYKNICSNTPSIHRMNRKSAETAKVSLNCFLAMKVTYANLVGDIAKSTSCDANKILEAIGSDTRIGSKFFKYGYGFGGPCFPRDTRALSYYGASLGIDMELVRSVDNTNRRHLDFQIERFKVENPQDKPIIVSEVTYKSGVDIIEASEQLRFAEKLAKDGYDVTIIESEKVIDEVRSLHGELFRYQVKK